MEEFEGLTREELVGIILELRELVLALRDEVEELRSLRPAVIARKVCGGTRSKKGSETKMTLMSLFGTWTIRGLDAMEACRRLLTGKSVLFPDPG